MFFTRCFGILMKIRSSIDIFFSVVMEFSLKKDISKLRRV